MNRLVTLACAALLLPNSATAGHPIPFDVKLLAVDTNEGCDVADVDGDGAVEIVTGGDYYDGTRRIAQLSVWTIASV